MSNFSFALPKNALRFTDGGEVQITDKGFASALAELKGRADLVSCTTNNGACGNETTVNAGGCGKLNAKCNSSVISMDQITIQRDQDDVVLIRDYDLAKAALGSKLANADNFYIAISGIKGLE